MAVPDNIRQLKRILRQEADSTDQAIEQELAGIDVQSIEAFTKMTKETRQALATGSTIYMADVSEWCL